MTSVASNNIKLQDTQLHLLTYRTAYCAFACSSARELIRHTA